MATKEYYSPADYDIYHYSNCLYNVRIKLGLNMREFAKLLGINVSTYQLNEHQKITKIPKAIVDALVEKCNVPREQVLVKISNDEDVLTKEIRKWVYSREAVPYIQQAYKEFLNDTQQINDAKQRQLQEKIENTKWDLL